MEIQPFDVDVRDREVPLPRLAGDVPRRRSRLRCKGHAFREQPRSTCWCVWQRVDVKHAFEGIATVVFAVTVSLEVEFTRAV